MSLLHPATIASSIVFAIWCTLLSSASTAIPTPAIIRAYPEMRYPNPLIQTFKLILLAVLAIALLVATVRAQSRLPQFKDYPVTKTYRGKTAPLVLTREDRMFRTRLREAARMKPNFAGHYILTTWGCGTECFMGAVIDAKTGKVYWFPFTICCWASDVDENVEPGEFFRLKSRLIAFSGARNEKEGDEGTHFYKFENGRFVHIRSIMKGEQD